MNSDDIENNTVELPVDLYGRLSTCPSVLVVDGFGVSLTVFNGHLLIKDGLGRHRRERRLPRAQRVVRRIVILGRTGHLSLDAVRWCADTGTGLVQVDVDGSVLLVAGPQGGDDARLRRAQAAAPNDASGIEIAKALLGAKLEGQATVTRVQLAMPDVADQIGRLGIELSMRPIYGIARVSKQAQLARISVPGPR